MKYSYILKRSATLIVFFFLLGLSSAVQAQNEAIEMQTHKQEVPSIKIEIVESPQSNKIPASKNTVRIMTIEKSDKMVIVNEKDIQSNSKTVLTKNTAVITKGKSDTTDH